MRNITLVGMLALAVLFVGGSFIYYRSNRHVEPDYIPVGILHSLTGTMSIIEPNAVDADLLAIEEINARGGVLGKQLKPVIFDGASDWPTFARGVEKLITEDKVAVIFGCWTSASRKTALPVIEKHDHLLIYPLQYEGLEQSPNIFYLGATVNQQITPGVVWAFENLGKTFFLVGSDYVYPRASYEIAKYVIAALGGKVVGEEYIPLGSREVEHITKKIIEIKPEVILNNLVGESNIPFFEQLRSGGITPEKIPTMSFAFAEIDLQHLDVKRMIGDYSAFNYFQSIDSKENKKFIELFHKKYGENRVLSDYMEVAYFGVHLWAQAVEDAGTFDTKAVRASLKQQAYNAPEGVVSIDADTQHAWRFATIGKIQSNGQFGIIWSSPRAIQPLPYPTEYYSKEEWDAFLVKLYEEWGGSWAAA